MASQQQTVSAMAKVVWPLLFLTAALHVYVGLSSVAYLFMGVAQPASGLGGLTTAIAGGLQALAAGSAFMLASRHDLRGTTLAVAGSIVLGWLSMMPSVAMQGLDFHGEERFASIYFVAAPILAIVSAALTWRNRYPIAAALIVTAPTCIGILAVFVLAIAIAMYGF